MQYILLAFSFCALVVAMSQLYFLKKHGLSEHEADSVFSAPLGTSSKAQMANKVGLPLLGSIISFILFLIAVS